MNLSELRTQVRHRLGDLDPAGRFSDAMLTAWINEGYLDAAVKAEALQGEYIQSGASAAYSLPADFALLVHAFWNGQPLQRITIAELAGCQSAKGSPSHYYLWRGQLHLWPIPAESGELKLWYIRCPGRLQQDTDEPEFPLNYHDLLVTYACMRARQSEGNLAEAQVYRQEYMQRVAELRGDLANPYRDRFSTVVDLEW